MLGREAYLPGEVIEAVVHVGCTPDEQGGPLTLDWLAARAHGEWKLPQVAAGGTRAAQPALAGAAPGIIACDVLVQPLSALSYVVHIPLPSALPPSYRSAVPARAGARERSRAGPAVRLEYGVRIEAQRRVGERLLTATLVLPFDVFPVWPCAASDCGIAPADARALAGAWLWPTPAELADGAAVPHIPPALPMARQGPAMATASGASIAECSAPVRVELQVAGQGLGAVLLPEGSLVGSDGSKPVSLVLFFDEASPLVCVAACAKLQAVELFARAERPSAAPADPRERWDPGTARAVTIGECDAHTEHAAMVTLAVHLPLLAPPELSADSPVSCSWQLVLDMAVRPRAQPHAACSRLSWVHPLHAEPRGPARSRQLGLAGCVRF